MTEKQQSHNEEPELDLPDEKPSRQDVNKDAVAGGIVHSRTAALPAGAPTSLEYIDTPPSLRNRPPKKPVRKVPIVPTGDTVPDSEDSPSADLGRPGDATSNERKAVDDA